ncbi:ankyrin repeat domain-containing protein [Cryptosporangium sp. NPDC051539]|uniref:ankyrin repeat domain-containing protein n=1 Tax=Cryptosporangium sp. NPDC051539 TaxID=3363962 RepID=UPI0037978C8C
MEPVHRAVLADDAAGIAVLADAVSDRVEHDFLVPEVGHALYRGDTPLHLAAAGLRYEAARALLALGASADAVNRRGATSLHYACDPRPSSPVWHPDAQRRVVRVLVDAGAVVDRPDRGGVTALHRAVRARSPAAVAALLAAGADPRAATSAGGSTALHLAVAGSGASGTADTGGFRLEIVEMLLAAGASLSDVDRRGVAVADRVRSPGLRNALVARGHWPR